MHQFNATQLPVVHRLAEAFVPISFPGDEQISSSLLAGPCVDFNVMVRRSVARADVRVVRSREAVEAAGSGVLFAARGRWVAQRAADDSGDDGIDREMRFDAGDGCWWDEEPCAWRVAPDTADAILIAVCVRAASRPSVLRACRDRA